MNTLLKTSVCALVLAAALGASAPVEAAQVRADISTREAYVDMPVVLRVQIANATDFDPPTVPEIPGVRVEAVGEPGRSTQITTINGNTTTRTSITYSFSLTPTRAGTFQIPPIAVHADGQSLSTRPFEFVASKSETGDLLFVEITGKEKQIYVGQSLELMLRIWVRPYRDQEHAITLSEGDMWQLVSQKTNWGPFADRIQQLADSNQRPVGTEVLKKDRAGTNHSYYLYEIDATIYPKKPGRIDANDVQVVALYPTAIGESRDPFESMFQDMGVPGRNNMFGDGFNPFGRRLEITSVRPVVAEAKVEPIEVLEIPIADRPADYRGAVGKYQIIANASPTDVKAGDPINLVLQITGTGPLDLVQAPPLAELPGLTKDFKVSNEPLAGYVDGGRKLFGTTIRPRKEGITTIPAIPFTYFDPEVGKFVTVNSQPIEIKVAPAEMLALDDVVGKHAGTSSAADPAAAESAAAGPVLTNLSGNQLLDEQTPPAGISQTLLIVLAVPPIAVVGLVVARGGSGLVWFAGRFRSAQRRFATDVDKATRAAEVDSALRRLLGKRFGVSTSDNNALVGALRTSGYRNAAVRCERLLQQCESLGTAGLGSGPSLAELKQSALAIAEELASQRPAASRVVRRLRPTAAAIALVLCSLASVEANAADIKTAPLTPAQQQTLLAEATARYDAARQSAGTDSAEAKEAFADAAQKYQLVVDSGVHNAGLYFNLGNAYLESGATARAIANYERALRLDPTDRAARTNLEFAEGRLTSNDIKSAVVNNSLAAWATVANGWFNRFVSPRTVLAIAVAAWLAFWIALGLRLAELRFAWKSLATAALAVTAITATSYLLTLKSLGQSSAIVVAPSAELRTGDGANFPAASATKLAAGERVDFLRERGQWVQIRTAGGQSGWLPSDALEVL
ncbi:MAG: BatD family protein [Pirellulales bacterium]